LAGQVPEYLQALRIRDGRVIPFRGMIQEIRNADVIIVGESHDNMTDHIAQLDIIKMLNTLNVPIAIGLEMFTADSRKELDRWVQGSITLDDFLKIYYDNWSVPWFLYKDIFLYAREHRIPMVGLNVPERISKKVFESGFGSLTRDERREIPPGITCTVDREYKSFIDKMYEFHRSMSNKSFSNFCEAQMLWDSVMAQYIINRMKDNPGMKMVALVGIGHAWKRGIAGQIKNQSNYRCIAVLPEIPNRKRIRDITSNDADYLLMYK